MGLGVSQFGLNLSGYVFSVQNGLTEITPGVGELGGTLIKETIIDGSGNNFKITNSGVSTLFVRSTGHVGVSLSFPPVISFAIGDNDTGFDWISDGVLSGKSQNQEIFRYRFVNEPMQLFSIGTTTLDSALHVRASTANTSSFKIDAGVLLSSPQSGVIEFDGSLWYATIGVTRNTFSFINKDETITGTKIFTQDTTLQNLFVTVNGSGEPLLKATPGNGGFCIGTDGESEYLRMIISSGVSNIQADHITFSGIGTSGGDLDFYFTDINFIGANEFLIDSLELGFFGASGVTQPAAIPDAAGGATVDAEARTAINDLLQAVRDLGLIAT